MPGATRSPACRGASRDLSGSAAARRRAARLAVLRQPELLEPDAAHRLPQRRRPGRARRRHSLSLAVPRRPDRRARRRASWCRARSSPARSPPPPPPTATAPTSTATGCSNCSRAKTTARRRRRDRPRILDQSGARRAGAAPADLADQDARAHLRPRRLSASSTAATSTSPARCCASTCRRRTQTKPELLRAQLERVPRAGSAAATCRSTASSAPDAGKDYPEVAQALIGAKSASMVRVNDRGEVIVSVAVPVQRFRAVRGALLLSTQGGDIDQAVEAERLQIVKLFLHPARRHGGAVDPARRHHRGPGAAARRRRRARAPPHPLARRNPRLHRAAATRSGTCPARCAT